MNEEEIKRRDYIDKRCNDFFYGFLKRITSEESKDHIVAILFDMLANYVKYNIANTKVHGVDVDEILNDRFKFIEWLGTKARESIKNAYTKHKEKIEKVH